MSDAGLLLLITLLLLAVFGALVFRTYRSGHKHEAERPKYRMLDDD